MAGTGAEQSIIYPVLTLVGIAIMGYTLFNLGRERFVVPEMAIAERWPFEGVDNTKFGVWVFLASDVVVFGAVIGSYIFMRLHMGWGDWTRVPFASWPGLLNTYVLLTSVSRSSSHL